MAHDADKERRELIEKARKLGLELRKPVKRVKFTSYPDEQILFKFKQCAEALKMKLQDALTDALEQWTETKKKNHKHHK
jgi:hypothetical protein